MDLSIGESHNFSLYLVNLWRWFNVLSYTLGAFLEMSIVAIML